MGQTIGGIKGCGRQHAMQTVDEINGCWGPMLCKQWVRLRAAGQIAMQTVAGINGCWAQRAMQTMGGIKGCRGQHAMQTVV